MEEKHYNYPVIAYLDHRCNIIYVYCTYMLSRESACVVCVPLCVDVSCVLEHWRQDKYWTDESQQNGYNFPVWRIPCCTSVLLQGCFLKSSNAELSMWNWPHLPWEFLYPQFTQSVKECSADITNTSDNSDNLSLSHFKYTGRYPCFITMQSQEITREEPARDTNCC